MVAMCENSILLQKAQDKKLQLPMSTRQTLESLCLDSLTLETLIFLDCKLGKYLLSSLFTGTILIKRT